jgi:hypothetical protein
MSTILGDTSCVGRCKIVDICFGTLLSLGSAINRG